MKIGIIGKKGKSTIWGALTGTDVSNDYERAVKIKTVDVFDERIPVLAKLYNSKKEIYNKLEFYDFPGFDLNDSNVKSMDGYILVLDNFSNKNPEKELDEIFSEMYLRDIEILEKRFNAITKGKKESQWDSEAKIIKEIMDLLNQEKHIYKEVDLESEKIKPLKGFQLYSLKPLFIIINNSEGDSYEIKNDRDIPYINVMGEVELEIALLQEDEKKEYLDMMEIKSPIIKSFTKTLYDYLNLITFFSCSEKEIKAWSLKKGKTIYEAAGVIHTDIMQGFIKAEIINAKDLIDAGGEKKAKESGLYRLEGKGYIVKDGDIVNIKFQKK